MIIGNGQLANIFKNENINNTVIFASGVSDSECKNKKEFEREEILLIKSLKDNINKKFVYFSSCALSSEEYDKNEYYKHKQKMENTVKKYSSSYYIFRIPQLFGDLMLHKTLVNFIYTCIMNNNQFNIYSDAYRYVIEINDVKKLVSSYLQHSNDCITVDIANPYRYHILEIVKILEDFLQKKAYYQTISKKDHYLLDLSNMKNFIKLHKLDISFGKNYLENHLKIKLL